MRSTSKYDERYGDQLVEFFLKYEENGGIGIPTMGKFCRTIGVSTETGLRWAAAHDAFRESYIEAMRIQEDMLCDHGLTRTWDPAFAKFLLASNHGYREKEPLKEQIDGAAEMNTLNVIIKRKDEKKKKKKGDETA